MLPQSRVQYRLHRFHQPTTDHLHFCRHVEMPQSYCHAFVDLALDAAKSKNKFIIFNRLRKLLQSYCHAYDNLALDAAISKIIFCYYKQVAKIYLNQCNGIEMSSTLARLFLLSILMWIRLDSILTSSK